MRGPSIEPQEPHFRIGGKEAWPPASERVDGRQVFRRLGMDGKAAPPGGAAEAALLSTIVGGGHNWRCPRGRPTASSHARRPRTEAKIIFWLKIFWFLLFGFRFRPTVRIGLEPNCRLPSLVPDFDFTQLKPTDTWPRDRCGRAQLVLLPSLADFLHLGADL